jgi:hypothetical protein
MKRKALMYLAVPVLVLSGGSLLHGQDNDGCSLSTLKGDYAIRISGQIYNSSGGVLAQRDGIVMTHYDGAGGFTQADLVLANGVLVPGPTDPATGFHINESGTYTVNADCTGSATVNFPSPAPGVSGAVIRVVFALSNHGRTIHQIVTSLMPPAPTGKQTTVPANIHADGEKLGSVPEGHDPNL